MKFNATYNLLVLLFLYTFCCTCILGIEASYDTNFHMAVVYNNVWSTASVTCFLAPLVIFFSYKVQNDDCALPESNGATIVQSVFNMFWFIGLFIVVMINMSATVNTFLVGDIETRPFLLGVLVNIFAIVAYLSNYFSSAKCIHSRCHKITVSLIIPLLSISAVAIAQVCLPTQYLRSVYRDGIRHDMLCDLEREIKITPDWTIDKTSWSSSGDWYDKIYKAIEKGDITVRVVDDTHVKMGWKRHLETNLLEKCVAKNALLKSYKGSWYSWGCYYEKTEKVVEMRAKLEKIQKDKQSTKKIDTSEKTEEKQFPSNA